jgi:hypothetical protein
MCLNCEEIRNYRVTKDQPFNGSLPKALFSAKMRLWWIPLDLCLIALLLLALLQNEYFHITAYAIRTQTEYL